MSNIANWPITDSAAAPADGITISIVNGNLTATGLLETGGPTSLAAGAIPNGSVLIRSGGTLVGATLNGLSIVGGVLTDNLIVGSGAGQTVIGGANASGTLTFTSTAHATKGSIFFGSSTGLNYNENTGLLGLNRAAAAFEMEIGPAAGRITTTLDIIGTTGNASLRFDTSSRAGRIRLDDSTGTLNFEQTVGGYSFDNVIKPADGVNIQIGTATGTKIGTGATQKISLWGVAAVVQPASTGTTTAGYTQNVSANTVCAESTFTGNLGATAYTMSDVVKNLKTAGMLAQ